MYVTLKLVAICASIATASGALTDIRFFAPQAWIGPDGTISFADTSAITVNVAHTFFRTFGLTKPSDADIVDFCDALDLNERTELAGLHALYSEPVLIFLEDFGGNAIAFYANNGLKVISHNSETRTIFEALLGASKTVFLAYKPDRFLRRRMRNSLAGRFFVPENFRFDTVAAASSSASQLKVTEAPIVFKKSDIPDLYPYLRSSSSGNFDIHQIQNAVMEPIPLALSEKAAFPTIFSSMTAAATNQVAEPANNVTTDADGLQSLFVRNPLAGARFARAIEDSGLPVTAESAANSMKAANYLANEAADYVLKALLAKNPEVGARIARQALKSYYEANTVSSTEHTRSTPITSTHLPVPTTTYASEATSTHTPIPTSTPTRASTSTSTPTYVPTSTPTHIPTSTPIQIPTSTPTRVPTTTSTHIYTPKSTHESTFSSTSTSPPESTVMSRPQTIHTPTPSTSTSAATPTSTSISTSIQSSNETSTELSSEPDIYMYDPVSAKIYRLISDDGTFPALVPGNVSSPSNVQDDNTKILTILTAGSTQPKETKSDAHVAVNNSTPSG